MFKTPGILQPSYNEDPSYGMIVGILFAAHLQCKLTSYVFCICICICICICFCIDICICICRCRVVLINFLPRLLGCTWIHLRAPVPSNYLRYIYLPPHNDICIFCICIISLATHLFCKIISDMFIFFLIILRISIAVRPTISFV